jgi:hypothetical protein
MLIPQLNYNEYLKEAEGSGDFMADLSTTFTGLITSTLSLAT